MLALVCFSSVQCSTLEGAELLTGKRQYQKHQDLERINDLFSVMHLLCNGVRIQTLTLWLQSMYF